MPCGKILAVEFFVIVDFSVERDPDRLVLVCQRLVPTPEVDYTEPPMSQSNARSTIETLVVGSPVLQRVGHPPEHAGVNRRFKSGFVDATDATHSALDLRRHWLRQSGRRRRAGVEFVVVSDHRVQRESLRDAPQSAP